MNIFQPIRESFKLFETAAGQRVYRRERKVLKRVGGEAEPPVYSHPLWRRTKGCAEQQIE